MKVQYHYSVTPLKDIRSLALLGKNTVVPAPSGPVFILYKNYIYGADQ